MHAPRPLRDEAEHSFPSLEIVPPAPGHDWDVHVSPLPPPPKDLFRAVAGDGRRALRAPPSSHVRARARVGYEELLARCLWILALGVALGLTVRFMLWG